VQRSFFGPSISLSTAAAQDVADAFFHSDWPPRELGILAVRLGATDQIFGHLENKWGGYAYLRRMMKDLDANRSQNEKQARKHLRPFT
jgi:hypothetical protein